MKLEMTRVENKVRINSAARKLKAKNTSPEPKNTTKNTTLISFKKGPPKHFYCIFVNEFLKIYNLDLKIFQKISKNFSKMFENFFSNFQNTN